MNELELKKHAGRLKLAWQSKVDWHFVFFREGKDGKPILVIDRKEQDSRSSLKYWKKQAVRKEVYEGTVGKDERGNLRFVGKSKLTEQQIRRCIVDNLIVEPQYSAMQAVLRGATYIVEDSDREPDFERRVEVDPDVEDEIVRLRRLGQEAFDEAPILHGTTWGDTIRDALASEDRMVVRSVREKVRRGKDLVTFLQGACEKLNEALEDKVAEFNAKVHPGVQIDLSRLRLLDLDAAQLVFEGAFDAPTSPPFPNRFSESNVGQALASALNRVNAEFLSHIKDEADRQVVDDGALETLLVETCGAEWTRVKHRLLDNPTTKDSALMWQMVLFRRRVVNALLLTEKQRIDGHLVVKSVGSQNLTSDYDLTLSTDDGSGRELQAIRNFNFAVKQRFGKQPGVVFDTNLYAKDFLQVDDNVLEPGLSDGKSVEKVRIMLTADRSDQDVAALTKMRQYMDPDEWQAYFEALCEDGGIDETFRKQIEVQLDETDALYLEKNREVWDRCVLVYEAHREDGLPAVPRIEELIETVNDLAAWADAEKVSVDDEGRSLAAYQEGLVDAVEAFQHEFEDLALEARNSLYLDKMSEVRRLQAEAKSLEDEPPSSELTLRIDALNEAARKLLGEANFFAAEAYLSEGPLSHIVFGNQSGNSDVFDMLKPEHFLESINEQTGDFFKDVRHYRRDDGEAFYQTSKYLARMLDGILKLATRENFQDLEDELPTLEGWGGASACKGRIETQLLPIRGAKGEWSGRSAQDKSVAAVTRARSIFALDPATIDALKEEVTALSVELNKVVRSRMHFRPELDEARRAMEPLR